MHISTKGFITSPKIATNLSSRAKREILKFLLDLPQLEAGKNKYGEIIERRGLLFIEPGNIVPLYETDEEYIKPFDEKYSKFENAPIKNMDEAEINYYIFSIGKLGWINCDRFIEFEEKIDLMVNIDESPDVKMKLVFNEIDGALKPKVKEGKYIFNQVPVGQTATIIRIKNTDKPINDLIYSKITLNKLRKKLDEI